MKIGLFLDFDGVLTPKAINMQFASMLKKEKDLSELELQYASGSIDNIEFNKIFVPLFRSAGFSKGFVAKNFTNIQLDTYASDIVQEPDIFTHIVTSSPSFFIDQFAKRYNIPRHRCICSEYKFDSDDLLEECVSPCGPLNKEEFVRRRSGEFDLTIGVGDSIEQDGPFLSVCDIKILMRTERRECLTASDLLSVIGIIRSLKTRSAVRGQGNLPLDCKNGVEKLLKTTSFDKNVFIMTPFRDDARYTATIKAVKGELQSAGFAGFIASDKTLANDLWANVRTFMHGCKYGIALMTAHEIIEGKIIRFDGEILNSNVVAEMGFMMGSGKEVLLLKDTRVTLPTDWLSVIYEGINFQDPEAQVRGAVSRWLQQLPN